MANLISEGSSKPEKYDCCYKLMKGDQPLGFGTINKDKENALFIFINKEQRGNGYGKELFLKMLEETKKMGCNKVKIKFSKENIPMIKIAEGSKGKKVSEDQENIKYVFSLR